LGPSSLTYAIFFHEGKLVRNAHSLTTMVAPLVSIALNKPTVTCLSSKLLFDRNLTTNTSCALINIHRSKVHVVERHGANASCTYVNKVFSTKIGRTSSTNTLFDKKQTLGITYKPFGVTKWIQLFSLAKKPFITYNLSSSKKANWVSWSFVNWFVKEKKSKNYNWGKMRVFNG
jgi:hypothetical protein